MREIGLALLMLLSSAAETAGPPPGAFHAERPDGTNVRYYVGEREGRRQPILLMLQGSGCESVTMNDRIPWMAQHMAPDHALLTIEKYGVEARHDAGQTECSDEFWRGNTLTQRAIDVLHVVAELRKQDWWNGEIVLFGGSEGGAVAAMAAPLLPETQAVVIWSSGIGIPTGEMIASALPPPAAAEAAQVFEEVRHNPTAEKRWGGASYVWWADALDLVPALALRWAPAPVLLVHGTRDGSAPVASARAARDLAEAVGKTNFTYRELEGYDHYLFDAVGRDRREAVLGGIAEWLSAQPRRRTAPR